MTYKFKDVIEKGQSFWAVSTSVISFTQTVEVPAAVSASAPRLPEDVHVAGIKRTLDQALLTEETKSVVEGVVVQVSMPLCVTVLISFHSMCISAYIRYLAKSIGSQYSIFTLFFWPPHFQGKQKPDINFNVYILKIFV